MPNLVGSTLDSAKTQLSALGVKVNTVEQLDDKATDGLVTAQDPAAGAPFAASVTLTVARRGVAVYLEDLSPVAGGTSEHGLEAVSGVSYTRSIALYARTASGCCNSAESSAAEYDLSRMFRRLRATLGPRDDSSSDVVLLFQVFADGNEVYNQQAALGQPFDLDLDMSTVLRLRIQVTAIKGSGHGVWGDARLIGLPSEVPSTTTTAN